MVVFRGTIQLKRPFSQPLANFMERRLLEAAPLLGSIDLQKESAQGQGGEGWG